MTADYRKGVGIMTIRNWRWGALLITAVLLLAVIVLGLRRESNTCMGVEILSDRSYERFTEYEYVDLSSGLYQDDVPLAIDVESSTIYISQSVTPETYLAELAGTIRTDIDGFELFFAPDDAFQDLFKAVEEGNTFSLLATKDHSSYMRYNVVFTNLPVMSISGSVVGADDEGRDLYSGSLYMWTPDDPDSGGYTVKSSYVQWHLRGGVSSSLPKKSWKISLKDQTGENSKLSFLGMGADDDWILNSMGFDDLKIREKLIATLWREIQNNADYPVYMSDGEYIEVIQDGKYQGVYLLQRRVDEKYLNLSDEDVLLKGGGTYSPSTVQEAYEVVESAMGDDTAYETALSFFQTGTPEEICLENWIDVDLLIQLGYMVDNRSYKNMFYLWHQQEEERYLYFIPWDTDMSFGYHWVDGFVYAPDIAKDIPIIGRNEYQVLAQSYPDLDSLIAKRWVLLRQTAFSEENIDAKIADLRNTLIQSGALYRDNVLWGLYHSGDDSIDSFNEFIKLRLLYLDNYYDNIMDK